MSLNAACSTPLPQNQAMRKHITPDIGLRQFGNGALFSTGDDRAFALQAWFAISGSRTSDPATRAFTQWSIGASSRRAVTYSAIEPVDRRPRVDCSTLHNVAFLDIVIDAGCEKWLRPEAHRGNSKRAPAARI